MPKAESTHIRFSSSDLTLSITSGAADAADYQRFSRIDSIDDPLLRACDAARASGAARAALMASVAELNPADPRHDAAYRAATDLRPGWERDINHVCHRPACTVAGLIAKAKLAVSLSERGQDNTVIGDPGLRVAASLASDLLILECAGT